MRGVAGSRVAMTVRRKGVPDPLVFDLTREEIHVQSVTAKPLSGQVAYVRIRQFQEGTHDEFLRAAAKLRAEAKREILGVLLDLRNNPGGLVEEGEGVADELLDSGLIYTTRHRGKIIDAAHAHEGGAFATVPIVALVNEYSASTTELLSGALQDNHRATIVGAPTFGKGSVQTIFPLPGGAGMRLTTMRYYTPSGRSIQAEGIRPDILIQPSKSPAPGEVVRERDLDGHLPAESDTSAVAQPPRPPPLIVEGKGTTPAVSIGDVPVDPRQGDDLSLSIAYDALLKKIAEQRAGHPARVAASLLRDHHPVVLAVRDEPGLAPAVPAERPREPLADVVVGAEHDGALLVLQDERRADAVAVPRADGRTRR